jgi:hypothetical protein
MMRFFWHLGYLVRKNVDLAEPWEKGAQYTDIDVLAVKVDLELNSQFVVCDCKSGAKAKTRERLFWLSGVMRYFGSNRGFFLRKQMLGTKYLDLADALGIVPLSMDQLAEWEKSYRIDTQASFGSFSLRGEKADQFLSMLRQYEPKVHNYILRAFWLDSPEEQIASLMVASRKIDQLTSLSDEARQFLNVYALCFVSLAIIRFSSKIMQVPGSLRYDHVKLGLLGGRLKVEERRNLLRGFHAFLTKEIKERYHQDYPITATQFEESFIPGYAKYLADFVSRICADPEYALHVPRYLDLFAYDAILGHSKLDLSRIAVEWKIVNVEALAKSLRDFLSFADRTGIASKSVSVALGDSISQTAPPSTGNS